MQTEAFSELFPLFSAASPETVEWLLSVAVEHEYPAGRAVLMEDSWGNAVYFVLDGWLKVSRLASDEATAIAIIGPGDFFGEMAILDESPRSTDVVSLSPVKLLSVSAQRFIQTLFKDPQLHHRLLQLMVRRLRKTHNRFQLQNQSPAIRLANTLVDLGEQYGKTTDEGIEIYNLDYSDLASISSVTVDEATKIMQKLLSKAWVRQDTDREIAVLLNFKQLNHLAGYTS
ncbi:MAG: Crp/Fnr family transcriptional regulator [Cyanobacteria bacterium P01_H01_bin.121]